MFSMYIQYGALLKYNLPEYSTTPCVFKMTQKQVHKSLNQLIFVYFAVAERVHDVLHFLIMLFVFSVPAVV